MNKTFEFKIWIRFRSWFKYYL